MKLITEYPPKLNIPQEILLTCLFQRACTIYGLHGKKRQVYVFQNGEKTQCRTNRNFRKIAYMPETQTYLMSLSDNHGTASMLYVLDDGLKEIDRMMVRAHKIEDVYFDAGLHLIFVVTPHNIQKYNCNGDDLGVLMNSDKKRRYRALCTFGKSIFLAYQSNGCTYVASYTAAGAFMERLSLGCEYTVQNMQVVSKNERSILRVYAVKNERYPFFIELALEEQRELLQPYMGQANIQIECVSEDETMKTSAYIKSS